MKKRILFIMGLVCAGITSVQAQSPPNHYITGTIRSAKDNKPLVGVSLFLKVSGAHAVTGTGGKFTIEISSTPDTLIISHISFHRKQIAIQNTATDKITIRLEPSSTQLQQVTVSTGYQKIPKARATGSFDFIDNRLLNRSVSPDILSRLKGITSGLLFDHSAGNDLNISIRGRSTLFANTQPLIILDNFEYTGDISDINPNDIESITVLKDAAAASIWGARSGNGVIVITTKKGRYNSPLTVSFNSNVTVAGKPDLFYEPLMSAADYISVEKYLFKQGYYDYTLISPRKPPISPVIEILNKEKNGKISEQQANTRINKLKGRDVRNDLLKYFFRKSVHQQYAVNLKGGGSRNHYFLSVGYDKDLNTLMDNQNNRLTVNANNVYALINHKLEITTGLIFTKTKVENNGIPIAQIAGTSTLYPYTDLVDARGNALPLALHRQDYIDTAGDGKLLDWNYRPLDEVRLGNNTTNGMDYQANLGIQYHVLPGLDVSLKYQYAKGETRLRDLNSLKTYSTRDQINQYTEITPDGLVYPIPLGGILYINNSTYTSQNFRGQVNYNHTWNNKHVITAIAGMDIKDFNSKAFSNTFYGYDDTHGTSMPVDFVNFYPNFITGGSQQIGNGQRFRGLADRYLSYYLNAAYTYDNKYTLSMSGRKDASNLFGVKTNQKWVPLWSAGASWNVSDEPFYRVRWLPYLKLRTTFGYNGNIDKNVAAYLTSRVSPFPNTFGEIYARVVNPPNPELRWERVKTINFGIDFRSKNNRISGSLDYYIKNGIDLIGNVELAPSTGISGVVSLMGNTAKTKSKGIDLVLKSQNLKGAFNWNTTFLLSWTKNKVTDYTADISSVRSLVNPRGITPKVGSPINALYSYKWAGLDTEGNPQGYIKGKLSENYSGIVNSTDENELVFSGSLVPTVFGALLNRFNWKQFSFSFNISYKFGYYLRRNSISYTSLFGGSTPGHKDFEKRWQKPGDENHTDVPSMIYPGDYFRDQFYLNSSALVIPGDHIRLQDIQLSYTFNKKLLANTPLSNIRVYLYASNLGMLWRKNKEGIDPDYLGSIYAFPPSKSYAAGINFNF